VYVWYRTRPLGAGDGDKLHGNTAGMGIKIVVFLRDGDECHGNTAGMGPYTAVLPREYRVPVMYFSTE